MDGKHPIRKKDKDNPYELTVDKEGYYVTFFDGQGIHHKEKICKELYELFDRFELEDISYLNVFSRHHEQSELTEQSLNERAFHQLEPLEDTVLRRLQYDQLHTAIGQLPENQRKRLILHYFHGMTYEQIAMLEGCTIMPVKRSIDKALNKLCKSLK